MTGSLEPNLKNKTAGNANTPNSFAICQSFILTKFMPAASASSSMCSISNSTFGHCLQSLLSKTCEIWNTDVIRTYMSYSDISDDTKK